MLDSKTKAVDKKTKTSEKKVKDVALEKKAKTSTKKSKDVVSEKKAKTSNKKTKDIVLEKQVSSKKSTKSVSSKSSLKSFSPEYYDLPFKYNKTVVKILAQTPTNLFIYLEISDEDRQNLKNQYGEYFFQITKPVLIIHNLTMDYSFEIDIDDFANSWYLKVNDSNCEYEIELGRRPIPINYNYMPEYNIEKEGPILPIENPYIYISSSNDLDTPNDHILFNNQNKVYYKNLKSNEIIEKDIKDFPFIINENNQFVSIYELYQYLYQEEFVNNIFDLTNPSSGNPSSLSFSSRFK